MIKKQNYPLLILALIWLTGSCRPLTNPTVQTSELTRPTLTETLAPRLIPTVTEKLETPTATTDIVGTVIVMSEPRVFSSLLSPDGNWRAEVVIHDCVLVGDVDENAYEQLRLVQVGKGISEVVDTQLRYCSGLGAFGLAGMFWSPNSRYFYYTNAREGGPDGCGYWERPILRVDVNNMKLEYLGGGPRSPDGTKLAMWQGRELVVRNVNGGEIARISETAPNAETGPITWSPDSQALVYLQFASYCPLAGKSYVVRLDLPEFRQTLLLESETPTFGGAAWDIYEVLKLFDENGKEWYFDFATKELK